MPTPAQYLDSSFKKQILELVPVSTSGTSQRFQIVYGGTPLPEANQTTGISFTISPAASGLPIDYGTVDQAGNIDNSHNYSANYQRYYAFGDPLVITDNSGITELTGIAGTLTGRFPNSTTLPAPILEFSISYPSGPLSLEINGSAQGYSGIIEYSDDARFPSLISSNTLSITATNSVGADSDKLDYFSIAVPNGTTFDDLTLSSFSGSGSANYTIYKSGTGDSSNTIVAAGQISSGQSGTSTVTTGQNLLTGGTTKSSGLTAGLYTIKIENQASSEVAYQLDFSSYINLPSFIGAEDTPTSILLPISTASGGKSLTWSATSLPADFRLETSNGQTSLVGQTPLNFNGLTSSFDLTATETGTGGKVTTYPGLKLSIAAANDAPTLTAVNQSISGIEDTPKLITYEELLAASNASDIDGDAISFRVESLLNGTASLKKLNGSTYQDVLVGSTTGTLLSRGESLQWNPVTNANGILSAFKVIAVDAALASSPPIEVKINTALVNDAPTLSALPQSAQLIEAGGITNGAAGTSTATIALNKADVDGTTPTYITSGWSETAQNSGIFTKTGTYGAASLNISTGIVSYTLDNTKPTTQSLIQGAQVNDTFAIVVTDGSAQATTNAVFSITGSNDEPTLSAAPQSAQLIEAGGITNGTAGISTATIALNKADVDGTTPTYVTSGWNETPQNSSIFTKTGIYGAASLNISTGIVSYTLDNTKPTTQALIQGAQINDTFAIIVSDGSSQATTNAVFSITGSNDAPTLNSISTLTGAAEDAFKEITFADLAAVADEADVDSSSLSFRIESVSTGTLQKWNVGSSAWDAVQAGSTLLSAEEKLQWKGAQDANGELNAFSVKAWDGSLASGTAVQVKVNTGAINDAPTLTAISTITGATEDVFKEITFSDLAAVADEADADSINLSFRIESVSTGTLQKWNVGSSAWDAVQAGSTRLSAGEKLQWKGTQDANGEINAFSVRVWDGSLASTAAIPVKIATAAVDDTPTLSPSQNLSIRENQPFTTTFQVNNVDPQDHVVLSLEGPDSNAFTISERGEVALKWAGNFENKQAYSLTVRARDANTPAQLTNVSSLSLSILDQPDQVLNFTPQSLAFVPTVDTRVTLNGSYSQDAALDGNNAPTSFSAVLNYNGASLDLAPSSLNQSGLTVTNTDGGSSGTSTLTISSDTAAQVSSFKLDFDVAPGATGPFSFSWNLYGASQYEQLTNSPITISPDAEAFIKNGQLDLSVFQTPLSIDTASKNVVLLEQQQDVRLPYTQTINSVRATALGDQISVAQALTIEAGAGDDTLNFTSLANVGQPVSVNARLGAGRDTLLLPITAPPASSQIRIEDFQLGFDRFQTSTGVLVSRRSDVLAQAADVQSSLRQSAVSLRYAAIATDLDAGSKTLLSNQSPLVSSSIALDPGSDGRQLKLELTSTPARIELPAQAVLPSGYSWVVSQDGRSATLTLPAQFSLLTGLGELRQAVSAVVASASTATQAGLNLQWLDAQQGVLASVTSQVQISPQAPSGGAAPLKLDFVASAPTPALVQGSTAGDTIQLLSSPTDQKTDKAFGGLGDDVLIAGDGDRLIGGVGADTMIARLGLGSTQLSGGADNDLLIGGANDGLVGGAGDDTLVVRGLGNRLIGGSGRDLFVLADAAFGAFSPGATAPNRILDFTAADTLAFNLPGLQRSDIKLVETTAGTLVQLSEAWSVRLGASDLAVLQGVHGVSESQLAINQGVSALTPAILSRVDLINQTA